MNVTVKWADSLQTSITLDELMSNETYRIDVTSLSAFTDSRKCPSVEFTTLPAQTDYWMIALASVITVLATILLLLIVRRRLCKQRYTPEFTVRLLLLT